MQRFKRVWKEAWWVVEVSVDKANQTPGFRTDGLNMGSPGVRNTQYRNIWDTVERAPTLTGEAWELCLFIQKDTKAHVMHNHG